MTEGWKGMDRQLVSRLSLIFLAGFMFAEGHENWIRGKVSTHLEVFIIILVTYGFAFALLIFAGLKGEKTRHSELVALCATIFTIITSVYVMSVVDFMGGYRTDTIALSHYSASLYLDGINPYLLNLQDSLSLFAVDPEFITVTVDGDIITSMNYPSLHFLFLVPAVALGVPDMRVMILVFEVATIAVVFRFAPRGLKGIVLLPFLASPDLAIGFTSGCIMDFLWVFPCAIATLYMDKPRLSGFTYGLACAVKQVPWIAFPFLAIWQWKTAPNNQRLHHLRDFSLFTIAAFVIPNLHFILWDWRAWLSGILTPITGGLIFLSRGISFISQIEAIPLPPSFYLICFITILVVLVFNYFYYFDVMKYALWILPGLALWFSYRALQNYFVYWIPLLVISIIQLYLGKSSRGET